MIITIKERCCGGDDNTLAIKIISARKKNMLHDIIKNQSDADKGMG